MAALLPSQRGRTIVALAGCACALLPDVDVLLLFALGVPYASMLGHRGITHSLPFAVVLGALVALALRRRGVAPSPLASWLYLSTATASHGVLDAFTDGGLGVAFFAPFSASRYFFPVRPIEVSPLGVPRFLSDRGVEILANELVWIWLPGAAFVILVIGARRLRNRKAC